MQHLELYTFAMAGENLCHCFQLGLRFVFQLKPVGSQKWGWVAFNGLPEGGAIPDSVKALYRGFLYVQAPL